MSHRKVRNITIRFTIFDRKIGIRFGILNQFIKKVERVSRPSELFSRSFKYDQSYIMTMSDSDEVVTIYDLEIPRPLFESVQEKLESLDPSRNYGKKHVGTQAFRLLDHLLDEELKEYEKDLDRIEKRISDMREVLD